MTFKIDMRNFPRDEKGELTILSQNGDLTLNHQPPTFQDVREKIMLFVATSPAPVGRSDIANYLGFNKRSPWLLGKIESLVEDGRLNRINGRARNGYLQYFYEVTK